MDKGFRKFLLLWSGELISSIGGGLTSFGLAVYVFEQTGNAASTALITLLAFLPALFLRVPAGVLADRFDRRLLMMLGDGCSAVGIVYILICMMSGEAKLWQICIGVTVSSVFSSLLDPAYMATISDLLPKEAYAKASGLVSMAGNARFLISPALAGVLLTISDIKLLLILDICTFFLTVAATAIVRRGLPSKKQQQQESFGEELRTGWRAITENPGILALVIMAAFMSFSMGAMQTLSQPMVLDFAGSRTLGTAETVCACGMLVTGGILGIKGMKKGFVRNLCLSLGVAGVSMVLFGIRENIILICVAGFLFFSMLPVANGSLDFLVRTNIPDEVQGRAWGLMGFLTQIGCVAAYGLAGIAADQVSALCKISVGRGSAVVIMISGAMLVVLAVILYRIQNVRTLEIKCR